jgi:membrane fusion protein, copper/silver efflux system
MTEPIRSIPLPNPKALKKRRSKHPIPWALIRFVIVMLCVTLGSWLAYRSGLLDQYKPQLEHGWAVLTNNQDVDHSSHQSKVYTCPMHPEIVRSKEGECPICGMDLVLREQEPEPSQGSESDTYTCPMHPSVLRDKPGECPICGMDLVKIESKPKTSEHEGHDMSQTGEVTIDPQMLNNLGVRTETVEVRNLSRTVRLTGDAKVDDSKSEVLQSWVGGRIEKVHVTAVGDQVGPGQPLVTIYSPQLLASSEELISALQYLEELKEKNALPQAVLDAQAMVESTEKRLRLWGVTEDQIESIKTSRKAHTEVVIYSTGSGTVDKKMAYQGQYVKEGTPLYELINLGDLWVYLNVFENDMGLIYEGMPVEFKAPAYPEARFYGEVTEIEPMLDGKSRTGRVRVRTTNPGAKLIPGMYVESEMKVPVSSGRPTVSNLAVIRTGKRDLVIVAKGEGRFYPQEVTLGRLADGYYPILGGLRAGQVVVSQASFLIDSESQIKAALQQMKDGPMPGGHQH